MKTAKELINDYNPLNASREASLVLIETLMKVYAEQAIDLASERAKTMKTGNSGSYYDASVDKSTILDIKKELK